MIVASLMICFAQEDLPRQADHKTGDSIHTQCHCDDFEQLIY